MPPSYSGPGSQLCRATENSGHRQGSVDGSSRTLLLQPHSLKSNFPNYSRNPLTRDAVEGCNHEQWHAASNSPIDHRAAGRIHQGQQKAARRCDARLEGDQGTSAGRPKIVLQAGRLSRRAVPRRRLGKFFVLGRLLQPRQCPVSHLAPGLSAETGRCAAQHSGLRRCHAAVLG